MTREKLYGSIMIILALVICAFWTIGLIGLLAYGPEVLTKGATLPLGIPCPPLIYLIYFPIWIGILIVALLLGWVGVALIRTPPIEQIDVESLEKEIEEEAKRIMEEKEQESAEQREA